MSLEILVLPGDFLTLDSQLQYQRNPVRCHRTTVSGLTRMSDCFQEDQKRRARSQKSRSTDVSLGRGCLRFKTLNCCRSIKFSISRLRRERNERVIKPNQRRNIADSHSRRANCGRCAKLLISQVDRILASHRRMRRQKILSITESTYPHGGCLRSQRKKAVLKSEAAI